MAWAKIGSLGKISIPNFVAVLHSSANLRRLSRLFRETDEPTARRKVIIDGIRSRRFLSSPPVLNFVAEIDAAGDRSPETVLLLARVYLTLRRGSDAVRIFSEAAGLSAGDALLLLQESAPLDQRQRVDFLLALSPRVRQPNPDFTLAAIRTALKSGRPDTAIQFIDSISEVSPEYQDELAWVSASAYLLLNDQRKARAVLEAAELGTSNRALLSLLASVRFDQGDLSGALAILDRLRGLAPLDDADAFLECLCLRTACKFRDAALKAWVLSDKTSNGDLRRRAEIVALFCAQLTDDTDVRAEAIARVRHRAKGSDPLFTVVALTNLGEPSAALRIGARFWRNVRFWRKKPPNPVGQLWRWLLLMGCKRWSEALTAMGDAPQEPIGGEAAYLRGFALMKLQRVDEAVAEFDRLLAHPIGFPAPAELVELALNRGDVDQAAQSSRKANGVHGLAGNDQSSLQPSAEVVDRSGMLDRNLVTNILPHPRVTVQVSSFNDARFLTDALNSVWAQDYPFWECIIVDDGSTDTSVAIAKAYAAADSRFRLVVHEHNKGLAAARNTGIAQARGAYITFLDSDDFLGSHANSSRYFTLVGERDSMVAGAFCGVNPAKESDFGYIHTDMARRVSSTKSFMNCADECPFNSHAPLLRVDVLREAGGFDESLIYGAEDWDCWARLARRGYSFVPTHYIAAYYRRKRGSMVRTMPTKHVSAAISINAKMSRRDDSVLLHQPAWRYPWFVALAQRTLQFAAMAYMSGDMQGFAEIASRCPLSAAELAALVPGRLVNVREGIERYLAGVHDKIGEAHRKPFVEHRTQEILAAFVVALESRQSLSLPEAASGDDEEALPVVSALGEPPQAAAPATFSMIGRLSHDYGLEESHTDLATIDKLQAYRDLHAGQRCFILGNGPSLNKLDLTKLDGEISIAVNGIFYKTDQTGFRPTYYVVEDTSVLRENLDRIRSYEVKAKFFPTIYRRLVGDAPNTSYFTMNRGFYEPRSPNYRIPRFSTDFSRRAFAGQSVTYINLQLAYYMGFTEVYLIGMDFSYVVPQEFERVGDIIKSTGDDPNHFHPDYFGKGKTWKNPKLDRVLINYRMAQLAYEATDRRIFNATAGGKLELFQRVDFNSL